MARARSITPKKKLSFSSGRDNPYALNLFFTGKCNLDCKYCFVDKRGTENSTLDEASLKKSVDIFFSYPGNKKTISFIGGEPTLEYPLIKKVFEYAKRQSEKNGIQLEVVVMTNGTLLNQEMMDYFSKHNMIPNISIDGNKKTHDRNRPFRGEIKTSSFNLTMKNVDTLDSHNLHIVVSMVFTPQTAEKFLENIIFLSKKNFYDVEFFPDLYADWKKEDLEKFNKIFKQFENYYIQLFKKNNTGRKFKIPLLDTIVNDIGLGKAKSCGKIHVDTFGNFYVCDKVFSLNLKNRKNYIIGNTKNGIDNERRSGLLEELRGQISKKNGLKCGSCKYSKYCFCPVGHYIFSLDPDKNDLSPRFWGSFCYISKVYTKSFLRIKKALKYNSDFINLYKY